MHKIEFCCTIRVDLALYGTSIYHSGVSTWQNCIIKYTWKMKLKSQTPSAFVNFSNLEKIPGITTLFFKLAEDDNLTGLQTISKKAFHMLISKITTKHCGTICHSKISSLGKLFLFLVQMLKSFELTLFFWIDYKPSSSFEHLSPTMHFGTIWLNSTQFITLCTIEHNMD